MTLPAPLTVAAVDAPRASHRRARPRPVEQPMGYWYMSVGLSDRFKAGGPGVIEALLASDGGGLNVQDHQGKTPLAWAASGCMVDTVQRLIAAGADLNRVDRDGLTPLLHALGHSGLNAQVAQALIDAGADLTVRMPRTGETVLHLVASAHFDDLVIEVLARKGNPLAVDNDGYTALHAAVKASNTGFEKRDRRTVKALLDAGADVNAVSAYEQSPLACAVQSGCLLVAEDLINAGASLDIPCGGFTLQERTPPDRWAHWERLHLGAWARSQNLTTIPGAAVPRPRL